MKVKIEITVDNHAKAWTAKAALNVAIGSQRIDDLAQALQRRSTQSNGPYPATVFSGTVGGGSPEVAVTA